jgi:hypothetical protein
VLELHLLTADPSRVVAINHRVPLTPTDLRNLDQLGIIGRGYGPARLRFRSLLYTSAPAAFPAATADWPLVTHWLALRVVTVMGGRSLTCLGYGPIKNPLVVHCGEQAEMVADALFQAQGAGISTIGATTPPFLGILASSSQMLAQQQLQNQQQQAQAPIAAMTTPPAQPHTWVTLGSASNPPPPPPVLTKTYWSSPRCECGAEKTWGPGAGGHSSWCPKAVR